MTCFDWMVLFWHRVTLLFCGGLLGCVGFLFYSLFVCRLYWGLLD